MPREIPAILSAALTDLMARLGARGSGTKPPAPGTAPPPPAAAAGEAPAVRFDLADPAARAASPAAADDGGAQAAGANRAPDVLSPGRLAGMRDRAITQTDLQGSTRARADLTPADDPDAEARARAWAIQSLARENTLGLIDRMARRAVPPPQAGSPGGPAAARQPADPPRTLAIL